MLFRQPNELEEDGIRAGAEFDERLDIFREISGKFPRNALVVASTSLVARSTPFGMWYYESIEWWSLHIQQGNQTAYGDPIIFCG